MGDKRNYYLAHQRFCQRFSHRRIPFCRIFLPGDDAPSDDFECVLDDSRYCISFFDHHWSFGMGNRPVIVL